MGVVNHALKKKDWGLSLYHYGITVLCLSAAGGVLPAQIPKPWELFLYLI